VFLPWQICKPRHSTCSERPHIRYACDAAQYNDSLIYLYFGVGERQRRLSNVRRTEWFGRRRKPHVRVIALTMTMIMMRILLLLLGMMQKAMLMTQNVSMATVHATVQLPSGKQLRTLHV